MAWRYKTPRAAVILFVEAAIWSTVGVSSKGENARRALEISNTFPNKKDNTNESTRLDPINTLDILRP